MDFYQHGLTTLHRFEGETDDSATRTLVARHSQSRPVALVLPMVYSELDRPALLGIRQGLQGADYLNEVVVALTASSEGEASRVRDFFDGLPMPTHVAWCEGPETAAVCKRLTAAGFDLGGFQGKGLAVWLGLGIAAESNYAIVVHDADIEHYEPRIIERLALPLITPNLDFYFSKGYYARVDQGRMYGRVTRLLLWPIMDALTAVLGEPSPFLTYLRQFRYPLSGEMALTADLARNVRMPTDWGLELGLLGEVYRNTAPKRKCQVDLGYYSHKHRELGADAGEGLQRMALDLATALFRLLASFEGLRVTPDFLVTLRAAYRREAQDAIRRYNADCVVNGMDYDRHNEESMVETFEPLIEMAGAQFSRKPTSDQIGEWLRALSAAPDAASSLRAAAALNAGSLHAPSTMK
ncbi:MAG: glucosyl-3-phosphoglycerate synthase [Euryarchaeota archaeon]|nr:glucosyl-3-phosphoglycerate synthase [Euryarchaeota archaeon]